MKKLPNKFNKLCKAFVHTVEFYTTSLIDTIKGLPVVEIIELPMQSMSFDFLCKNRALLTKQKDWYLYRITLPYMFLNEANLFRALKKNLSEYNGKDVRLKIVKNEKIIKQALETVIKVEKAGALRKYERQNQIVGTTK